MKRIEKKVSDTILQTQQEIKVGNKTYMVAPPSTATLIKISELVAKLPAIELNPDNLLSESLFIAKDCHVLGDIIAVMILGVKKDNMSSKSSAKRLFGIISSKKNKYYALSKKLLEDTTPSELSDLTIKLLSSMEIQSFFSLTTSLIGINLLKQTRGVVTTASGQ